MFRRLGMGVKPSSSTRLSLLHNVPEGRVVVAFVCLVVVGVTRGRLGVSSDFIRFNPRFIVDNAVVANGPAVLIPSRLPPHDPG